MSLTICQVTELAAQPVSIKHVTCSFYNNDTFYFFGPSNLHLTNYLQRYTGKANLSTVINKLYTDNNNIARLYTINFRITYL